MKFGVTATCGSAAQNVAMAVAAEEAGWDGFMAWDGISVGSMDTFDPWTLLGAAAVRTSRITLGAMVFSLPRRKPWEVARQALTVDQLSGGRLVLPVGLGAVDDGAYSRVVGEHVDVKERAALLDESLAILDLAWTGEKFSFQGAHHQLTDFEFQPRPVHGTIPVWVIGAWFAPRSMRRAAGRDGVIAVRREDGFDPLKPDELREVATWVAEQRGGRPFELVAEGVLPDDPAAATDKIAALEAAGVTWWIDSNWDFDTVTPDGLLERIRRGPLSA
ncbi:LLM class flavin-dependent oxidoreductase [Cellulomonas fengjieae]|uniref:LLM class flavin-dependent oxidoreductase n=1 Tax=Cellulomonas fengjieae TaxID=2819978 RepID=UPI001AAF92F7|nr:LLM class flavin-dependent oxidoreductase [Cellulomonas fengjieae]MBO3101014.1 LLM class flavin-dependent oxidoreductase [Cellulomonas fengjieae]